MRRRAGTFLTIQIKYIARRRSMQGAMMTQQHNPRHGASLGNAGGTSTNSPPIRRFSARPTALTVNADGIPAELQRKKRWVVWRFKPRVGADGAVRWVKVPANALTGRAADVTDPRDWFRLDEALATYQRGGWDGIGIVMSGDDHLVGLDLDHCRDPLTGELTAEARAIVAAMASLTMLSPSGTGLRIFVRAAMDRGGCKRGDVELYGEARYLTVSGVLLA
jgi:primase-polymerase (primpol)-like protein